MHQILKRLGCRIHGKSVNQSLYIPFFFLFRARKIGQLDHVTHYMHKLVANKKFYQPQKIEGLYALAGDQKGGKLSKKWILVEDRYFFEKDGEKSTHIHVCDCIEGHENKVRLDAIDMIIESETLDNFQSREESLYCIHCKVVQTLKQTRGVTPTQPRTLAEIICTRPFAALAHGGSKGYGIIVAGHKQFKCDSCKDNSCVHLDSFKSWNEAQDQGSDTCSDTCSDICIDALDEAFAKIKLARTQRDQTFKCISSHPIAWPVDHHYRKLKSRNDTVGFPLKLIPKLTKKTCSHGARYVLTEIRNDAVIHRESSVKTVSLFAYKTTKCDCSVYYDGHEDLLLNLNNKHLFDMDWLFSIFDRANYSECPLMTAYTTATLARQRCQDQGSSALTYRHLSDAYNCFIR